MSLATMDGCYAKLARAEHHLRSIEESISTFRAAHPFKVTVERNVSDKTFIFRAYDVEPCDPEWGTLIGDFAHNARSALDHLVFQLSILGLGRDLTPVEAKKPQFPVYETLTAYRGAERGIAYLLPEHKQRIWEIQRSIPGMRRYGGHMTCRGPPLRSPCTSRSWRISIMRTSIV